MPHSSDSPPPEPSPEAESLYGKTTKLVEANVSEDREAEVLAEFKPLADRLRQLDPIMVESRLLEIINMANAEGRISDNLEGDMHDWVWKRKQKEIQ